MVADSEETRINLSHSAKLEKKWLIGRTPTESFS
jgi:hypothetical protein